MKYLEFFQIIIYNLCKKLIYISEKPYKTSSKKLYLRFDTQEARSWKLGCSMVLDTRKYSKFDARTLDAQKKVFEVSLLSTIVFGYFL